MEKDPAIVDEEDARRFHTELQAVSMYRLSHKLWLEGMGMDAREVNFVAHQSPDATSTPALPSERGSSSTMPRAWSSAKPRSSGTTCPSIRASPWAGSPPTMTRGTLLSETT